MARPSLAERFAAKVVPGPDGCLLWTGMLNEGGYGVTFDKGPTAAHRVAWELAHGRRVPRGKVVRHTCPRKNCVAAGHLVLATRRTVARAVIVADNIAKTHCPKGHPLRGRNLARWGGQRRCRACHRARERDRYHRVKAEAEVGGSAA
jgi:hypothetical protein